MFRYANVSLSAYWRSCFRFRLVLVFLVCDTIQVSGKTASPIPASCPARWSSGYDQAVAINNNKICIQQLCAILKEEGNLDVDYQGMDWTNTSAVIEILALFSKTTRIIQGDNFITNSMMAMLSSQIRVFFASKAYRMAIPQHMRPAVNAMLDEFRDSFYPPTNCQMIAAVCDPRTKQLGWCDDAEKAVYRKATIEAMVVVAMENLDDEGEATPASDSNPEASAAATDDAPRGGTQEQEIVDEQTMLFAQLLAASALAPVSETTGPSSRSVEGVLARKKRLMGYELTRYLDGETLGPMTSSQVVLEWWFKNSMVFPVLFKVARVYLAVPASSGTSDRIFYVADEDVTTKRERLEVETVSDVVFLHGCHEVGWHMSEITRRPKKKAKTEEKAAVKPQQL